MDLSTSRRSLRTAFAICGSFVFATASNFAQFVTNQPAAQVIGQSDFVSDDITPITSRLLNTTGVAVDNTTGKLFVSDFFRNRVVRYANVDSLTPGAGFEAVIGQPDFTTATTGLSASKFSGVQGLAVSPDGTLYAADSSNDRVLVFPGAATITTGSSASNVLGQPDFVTAGDSSAATGMNFPVGITLDTAGRLWVAENSNNRVLRFDNVVAKVAPAVADGVLGQPAFGVSAGATTQAGMFAPRGVAAGTDGTLYVSDSLNNRILVFINAALKSNGGLPDGVLGQSNFVTGTAGTQRDRFALPRISAIGPTGLLAVADEANSRVLTFENPASLPNNAPAAAALGKPSFTVSLPTAASQTNIGETYAVTFDAAGRLYVADNSNHRVLRFDPPVLAGNSFQPEVNNTRKRSTAIFTVRNSGAFAADFAVTARFRTTGGKARVRLIANGTNVRPDAQAGTFRTGILPPGGTSQLVVRGSKRGPSTSPVRVRTILTANSTAYPALAATSSRSVTLR